mgnify:CR=1 FL=1
MYFRYFVIISCWKGRGPSFERTWIPFTEGCIVPSLFEIGTVVLEEKFFLFNLVNVLLLLNYYLPLGLGPSFNQTWNLITRNALCQVYLKLAKWFWSRRLLNSINGFLRVRKYVSMEKGGTLHMIKLESPSPKDALCQVWLKLVQLFWREGFFKFRQCACIFIIS